LFWLEFIKMLPNKCRNLLYKALVLSMMWYKSLEHNTDADRSNVSLLIPEMLCGRSQGLPFAFRRATFYLAFNNFFGAVRGHLHSNRLTAQLENKIRSFSCLGFTRRGLPKRREHSLENSPFVLFFDIAGHLLQSSSASRFTAGAARFFILSQSGERPER